MSEPFGQGLSLQFVKPSSNLLTLVIELGDKNKKTLGMLPRQAFSDYAAKGGIIAAVSHDSAVLGYVVFRNARNWTHIVHLCTSVESRGLGIAGRLLDKLVEDAVDRQTHGVRLKCRRDYEAHALWPRFGFVPRADTRGRGVIDSELTIWVLNLPGNDLFSNSFDNEPAGLVAVLDANVFYDLECGSRSPESLRPHENEAQHLKLGWVADAVEFCIVDEIHTEITRGEEPVRRDNARKHTGHYRELGHDAIRATEYFRILQEILGWLEPSQQQESDMKQVAKAAASEASLFITRDESILAKSARIYDTLQIRVLRPLELISSIDLQENERRYAPARLHGTGISRGLIGAEMIDEICRCFLAGQGERLSDLKARMRDVLGATIRDAHFGAFVVKDAQGEYLAVLARTRIEPGTLLISVARSIRSKLAPTIFRHLVATSVHEAAIASCTQIIVNDPFLSNDAVDALQDLHFHKMEIGWVRDAIHNVIPREAGLKLLEGKNIVDPSAEFGPNFFSILEQRMWPLKVEDSQIPCWIIPIRKEWARRLIDPRLGGDDLFKPDVARLLGWENVYYRSARPPGPKAPARILWYVPSEQHDGETGCIRACSHLLENEQGPANALFRRFERLGAYEWNDLLRANKGDHHRQIEALRFTDTELFEKPVRLPAMKALGANKMLQGPFKIAESLFFEIYRAAKEDLI